MPVLGIDVSHHNGEIDWFAVAGSDVKFAFAKATEGTSWVDERFAENWQGMGDAGLLRGAYHFARPGSDPEVQAEHFAAVVGPRSFCTLPPVLDLESGGGLPSEDVIAWTLAFVRKAEALFGQPLIIYTGGFWRRTLGNPDVPQLRSRWLWTARYGVAEPVIPRTWQRWDIWQFTDGESGAATRIPGVRGPCDCNRFRGNLDELAAVVNQPPAAPGPAPLGNSPPVAGQPPFGGRCLIWPHTPTISGDDVRAWQTRLRERGFNVDVDGFYGRQSRLGCMALQRELGLEIDGIVGAATWNATFGPG